MLGSELVKERAKTDGSRNLFGSKDETSVGPKDERSCRVLSVSINESLGQVGWVFTDKTGTLTGNKMQVEGLVIGDREYKRGSKGEGLERAQSLFNEGEGEQGGFYSKELEMESFGSQEQGSSILQLKPGLHVEYLKLMATCHDCVVHFQTTDDDRIIRYLWIK